MKPWHLKAAAFHKVINKVSLNIIFNRKNNLENDLFTDHVQQLPTRLRTLTFKCLFFYFFVLYLFCGGSTCVFSVVFLLHDLLSDKLQFRHRYIDIFQLRLHSSINDSKLSCPETTIQAIIMIRSQMG